MGSLGISWLCLWDALGAFENAAKRVGDNLTASWNVLGGSGRVLGRPWGLPRGILEAFLKDILAI